jgi:myo-inositol-1(or 4)-monophosphatase
MLDKESSVAREVAQKAGEMLMGMLGNDHSIVKKGEIDLVTEADLAAEKMILEMIHRHFPYDAILAEEEGRRGGEAGRTWVIDPLDGTTNYAHGFPFFAISIALEVQKEVIMGVVYNPYMKELFSAEKGRGAFLNGEVLTVSRTGSMNEALLVTGFPYDVHERPDGVVALLKDMLVRAQGVRRIGSAALDLCYVAAGRLDGFWEADLKPWDTAAGDVIVREAGGRLTTFEGESYTPYSKSVVASNGWIHGQMLEVTRR